MLKALLIGFSALMALVVALVAAVLLLVDVDDYRDTLAERASAELGREVSLQGPLSLKWFPWLAIEAHELHVGNPPNFAAAPELARVGRATLAVRVLPLLRGQLETGAITLAQTHIHLVVDAQGRSNLDGLFAGEPSRPDTALDLSGLELGELRLDEVTVRYTDLAAGSEARLDIDHFKLDGFAVNRPSRFQLRAQLHDAEAARLMIHAMEGELTATAALDRISLNRWVTEFELPELGQGSVRGAGTLQRGGNQRNAAAFHLEVPVLDLIIGLDGMRLGLRTEAPMSAELSETVRVSVPQFQLSLNEQAVSAAGQVQLGERLNAQLSINGDHLNLVPILEALNKPPASQAHAEPSPNEAIDLTALRQLDLELELALGSLRINPQLELSAVNAQARLRDGQLTVSPMQAELFGGQVSSAVQVDLRHDVPVIAFQPSLSNVDVARILRLVTPLAPLTGNANLSLNLGFTGLTLVDMLSTLDGNGQYTLREGTLVGLDLNALLEQDLRQATLGQITRSIGGETPFRTLTGQLSVTNGVLSLPDLQLLANDYGMSGQGQIDLAASTIRYGMTVQLGERLTAQLPRTVRELTSGSIPLQLSGPIQQPQVTIDLGDLAERSLRREIEERILRPRLPERPPEDEQPSQPRTAERILRELLSETDTETDAETEGQRERGRDRLLRELRDLRRDGQPLQ